MSLIVKGLCKTYGERKVVNNVNFRVEPGQVYGILGRNGAGKTTMIRMILNIISKDNGQVVFKGNPLNTIKTKIGYLPEEKSLYYKNTVKDQLIYFSRLSGFKLSECKKRISYWAERFQIDSYLNKRLDTLSKGNQQKVQIISTIINDPEIIIFDEPFSGLDPINSEILRNIVVEFMKKGKYILFSTHQMFYAEEFCKRISIMKNGNQVLEGDLLEIKKSYGRKKLVLEIEGNLPDLNVYGVIKITRNNNLYEIDLISENISNSIINILFNNRVKILSFTLKYRSLHEIFLDMAGD